MAWSYERALCQMLIGCNPLYWMNLFCPPCSFQRDGWRVWNHPVDLEYQMGQGATLIHDKPTQVYNSEVWIIALHLCCYILAWAEFVISFITTTVSLFNFSQISFPNRPKTSRKTRVQNIFQHFHITKRQIAVCGRAFLLFTISTHSNSTQIKYSAYLCHSPAYKIRVPNFFASIPTQPQPSFVT